MSLGNKRLNAIGEASVDKLPDGRKRITRAWQVGNDFAAPGLIETECFQAYGTPDGNYGVGNSEVSGRPTKVFPECLLVLQKLTNGKTAADQRILTKVYEELHASAETQVGENSVSKLEDGRTAIVAEFIQLSSATPTPGTPGTTTAPGDTSAFMQNEEAPDDGALRRIKRTYVYAGTLNQTDTQENNGKLERRTIVAVKTEPSTPAGYTRVSTDKRNVNGLTVYTYSYAKGDGEISRTVDYGQSSDAGTIGVTRTVIRHLTASSVSADPTTLVGSVKVGEDKTDQDGHRIWTITYAKGVGLVVDDVRYENLGSLVIYHRVQLGSAPTDPAGTIGGSVTLIDAKMRKEAGYDIYDRTWAEGVGEISRDIRYGQSSDGGTTGTTIVTIRHLTSAGTATDPTSSPGAGYVKISEDMSFGEGTRVWVVVWAKGAGTVLTEVSTRNGGKLILYHRVALGAAPTTPTATIGGTVAAISTDVRKDSGYDVYDYTWAEGLGVVETRKRAVDAALLQTTVDVLTSLAADLTAAITASGISTGTLVDYSQNELDGIRRWQLVFMSQKDGTALVAGTTGYTFQKYEDFVYPGRAKYYSQTVLMPPASSVTGTLHDVYLSPPETAKVLATHNVKYQTAATVGALTYTLWNPTDSCTLNAKWTYSDGTNFNPRSKVEALRGYRAVNAGGSGTTAGSDYTSSVFGERMPSGATWSIALSGGPSDPGAANLTLHAEVEPAFYDIVNGVQWYRRVEITATPAAQTALPV